MTWYPTALQALGAAQLDLTSGTFKVALCSSAYTPNVAHDFLDDVTGILATVTLVSPTWTGAEFLSGADQTITDPGTGTATVAVLYKDIGGSNATRRLVGYQTGLSLVFDGVNDLLDLPSTYLLRLVAV